MLLAQPRQPVADADLLVGGRDEDQVTRRLKAFASEGGDRDGARRDLALHVERAAPPDLAVTKLARPRIDLPLRSIRHDGVRVREQQQAGPAAPAGQARDEVRPLGHLRVELTRDAALREVVAQQLGRGRLVAGRIDGVDPDQLLEELRDLVAERVSPPRWRGRSGGSGRARAQGRNAA